MSLMLLSLLFFLAQSSTETISLETVVRVRVKYEVVFCQIIFLSFHRNISFAK